MKSLKKKEEHVLQLNNKNTIENILSSVEDDVGGDVSSIYNVQGKDDRRIINVPPSSAEPSRLTGCYSIKNYIYIKTEQSSRYGKTFTNIPVIAATGVGVNMTVNVVIGGLGKATILLEKYGSGYVVDDRLRITGLSMDGNDRGDIDFFVDSLTAGKTLFHVEDTNPFTTEQAAFNLHVLLDGKYEITPNKFGKNYPDNYAISIDDNKLFGFTTGITTHFIYKPKYNNIATTTNGVGTGLTVDVYFDDVANIIIKPINRGTGYKTSDIITIADNLIGNDGYSPITFNIKLLFKAMRAVYDVPSHFNLSKHARLVLCNISAINDDANTIYTIRCQELNDNRVLYQKKSLNNTMPYEISYKLNNPENLRKLTIDLSDSITNMYNGYANNIIYNLQLKIIDYIAVPKTFSDESKHHHEMIYYS